MKNGKTKIKFTDIAGMLDCDQMREIVGGCGVSVGSAFNDGQTIMVYGGGDSITSSQNSFASLGFSPMMGQGGTAGVFGANPGSSGGFGISASSSNSTSSSGSSSSASYSSTWNITSNGVTTNDPVAISRFFDFVYANNGIVNNSQINSYITNESTISGQITNNLQLYGTVLNEVIIINDYHGPSTIPQGIVIINGELQIDYSVFGSSGGGSIGGGGSSSYSNYLPQGVPPTDCFFQCLGWISQMNGDTVHDANYYASVYAFTHPNTSVIPDFDLSNFNIPSTTGMPLDQASAFTDIFFKATDYSGASNQFLSNWINPSTNPSGDRQLIGVYKPPSGGRHAVAVLSIIGTTVNYWDPQKGIPGSFNMSDSVAFYGISSNK